MTAKWGGDPLPAGGISSFTARPVKWGGDLAIIVLAAGGKWFTARGISWRPGDPP